MFMNAELLSLILITSTVLLSVVIYIIGLSTKKRLIQYLAGSLFIGAIIGYFVQSETMRAILVSFAVVAVAIISALSINETKRIRKENIEHENRDRAERLLNEIKNWALEAMKAAVSRQTRSADVLWETRLKYKYVWSQRFYISTIADKSFKNLRPIIDEVNNKLSEAIDVTIAVIEHKKKGAELISTENNLRESAEHLLVALASKATDIA